MHTPQMRMGMRGIFIGASVVIVAGCAAIAFLLTSPASLPAARPSPQPAAQQQAPKPIDPAATHQAWKDAVTRQISTLSETSSGDEIQSALTSLMDLTVTADDRDAHLKLVLDLIAWQRGDAGAYARVRSDASTIGK